MARVVDRTGVGPLRTTVHDTARALPSLGAEWDALLARSRCGSAFLGFDWLACSFGHVEEEGTRLHVISVRNGAGELVGLAPFCIRRKSRWTPRVLEFLGTRQVSSEYLDIVADPASESEVADAVWTSLAGTRHAWDYGRLSDVDGASVVMNAFRARVPAERFRLEVQAGQTCPYLPLPGAVEEVARGLSARFRGTLRRAERKMSELGVRLIVADGTTAVGPSLDRLYELHATRWGQRGQSGKLRDPGVQRFHREVAEKLSPAGRVRVYSLELRGATIAALYGLEFKGTFFYYQSGFDPSPPNGSIAAWDYSPGVWILNAAIRDSVRRGLREFDFLRGVEEYKTRWTDRLRQTSTLIVLPMDGWKGRVYHGLDTRIRQAKRRVRRWFGRGRGGDSDAGPGRPASPRGAGE